MMRRDADSNSGDDDSVFSASGERLWETLEHNGVVLAPPYTPHGKPIYYQGQAIKLHPEAEEVATMFAVMRESPYYQNEIFRRNFFGAWLDVLGKHHRGHPIRTLDLVDFDEIYGWFLEQQRLKRERTSQEKKRLREEAKAADAPYMYCVWDGKKEPLSRFKMEPPGLFRGRGAHPLAGCLKRRVLPEEVTINIGEEAVVPPPPPGHSWKAVIHDHTVAWMAMWRDTVTDGFKYVYPGPGSTFKNMSDKKKFERARLLSQHIDRIRASYRKDWDSPDRGVAQRAVAMYFIDVLALRVGNEKGRDEADTVGCCSLRVEHITLAEGTIIKFDFLGKDSIRYRNDVEVDPKVYTLISQFIRGKRKDGDVFDALTTTSLNEHLKAFMPGLSAKVFRTYNASRCLEEQLRLAPPDLKTPQLKLEYFNRANTKVAVLCNHQRSVPKNHRVTMVAMDTNVGYLKRKLQRLETALKTTRRSGEEAATKEFYADEDTLHREWLKAYGTEEQAADYENYVVERDAGRRTTRPSSSQKEAPTQRKRVKVETQDDEDAPLAAILRGEGGARRPSRSGANVKVERSTEIASKRGGRGTMSKDPPKAVKESPKSAKGETPKSAKGETPKSVKKESPKSAKKESPKSVKKEPLRAVGGATTQPKPVRGASASAKSPPSKAKRARRSAAEEDATLGSLM